MNQIVQITFLLEFMFSVIGVQLFQVTISYLFSEQVSCYISLHCNSINFSAKSIFFEKQVRLCAQGSFRRCNDASKLTELECRYSKP